MFAAPSGPRRFAPTCLRDRSAAADGTIRIARDFQTAELHRAEIHRDFPAFWVLARGVERRRLSEPLVVGVFSAGYGILALLFINWWHIF